MSCGLHLAWASANAGISSSGVPTYKTKSRQELSIHSFRPAAGAGVDGTVCRRENPETCCMNSRSKSSLKRRGNQCALCLPLLKQFVCARKLSIARERLSDMANKTASQEVKEHESERDIFCIVSDAFRCFAQ